MSAWSKPSISRKTSVSAKPWRTPAILVAASALAAMFGRAGLLKWATMLASSSLSSSGVTPRLMAMASSASSFSVSPLAVFRSSARPISVLVWACSASELVGLASFTTPVSVTDRPVAAANCVARIRSCSTCGCRLPCCSWPKAGFSPVSGLVVPTIMLPTY